MKILYKELAYFPFLSYSPCLEYRQEPEHPLSSAPALPMIRLPFEGTAGKGKSSSWKTRVAPLGP